LWPALNASNLGESILHLSFFLSLIKIFKTKVSSCTIIDSLANYHFHFETMSLQATLLSSSRTTPRRTPSVNLLTSSPSRRTPYLITSQQQFEEDDPFREVNFRKLSTSGAQQYEVYIWDNQYHKQFVKWWLEKSWVVATATEPKYVGVDLEKKLAWNGLKMSTVWRDYYQGAQVLDGKPVVVCTRCHKPLTHPVIDKNGSSSLGRHTQSEKCRKANPVSASRYRQTYINDLPEQLSREEVGS
jgi:hypothetical protein